MPASPKSIGDLLRQGLTGSTREWTRQKKREERSANARTCRASAWSRVTVAEVVHRHLEQAYLKASANNTLPATARQIYYAIREAVKQENSAGRELQYDYFAQTLLPQYVEEEDVAWEVVYDDRGHLHEPHGEHGTVGLGTLNVRRYLADATGPTLDETIGLDPAKVRLHGPEHHYGAILFVEKEGFMPLFDKVQLAQRFDLAIMSTKGMSNTASRELVDTLCGEHEIPLLVLHDFDVSGFSIVGTLRRDTARYQFAHAVDVIDLGLRAGDIGGLPVEHYRPRGHPAAVERTLAQNGATPQERALLLTQRVELNAFASDALIAWLEKKLRRAGLRKVIPDDDWLRRVYRHAVAVDRVSERLDDILRETDRTVRVPKALRTQVERHLKRNPQDAWTAAVIALTRSTNGRQHP